MAAQQGMASLAGEESRVTLHVSLDPRDAMLITSDDRQGVQGQGILMPLAPEDGMIENTFFNVGEWVPAGTPVVSVLPAFRVKLRFYVPEEDVALARMGGTVSFTCDSCPTDLKADIIYISPRSEFPPPVIYSLEERSKLVYLIQARPDKPSSLRVGQPISIFLDGITPVASQR